MEEKDDIKRVLKLLSEKLKLPENKELMEEFVKELLPFCSTGDSRIDEIYELCIEKIIKDQATAFYNDFPIAEIRSQLVVDFIRMERARRKDDFDEFCMAVYQQIECMVNKMGNDPILNNVAENLYTYPAYSIDGSVSNRKEDSSWLVSHMIFGKTDYAKYKQSVASLEAMDKFKCILYFVCYKSSPKSDKFDEFNAIRDDIYDVYKYRNKNHRGNVPTEKEKEIYNKIGPIQSFYYLKTIGLLAKIVEMVQNGYPLSKELIEYSKGLEKKELKPQTNIVSEAKKEIIEDKVIGNITSIRSQKFEVKINGKTWVVNREIQSGIIKGDKIEINGYQIVYGNNISLNSYKKI